MAGVAEIKVGGEKFERLVYIKIFPSYVMTGNKWESWTGRLGPEGFD